MPRLNVLAVIVVGAVAGLGCPSEQSEQSAAPAEAPQPAPTPPAAAAPTAPAAAPAATPTPSQPEGEPHREHGDHGDHAGMMKAASDACSGKAAGADCSFTSEMGEIKGKCAEGREKQLMCRGEGEEGHKGKMMDDSKLKEACASLAKGKTCSFQGPEGKVSGTCRKGHQGDQLLCMPEHARGGKERDERAQ